MLGQAYHDQNDPSYRRGQPTRLGLQATPESRGYIVGGVRAVNMAEAIRAYTSSPNNLKAVAPETARRLCEW